MRRRLLLVLVLLGLGAAPAQAACPSGVRVRQEVRTLTQDQYERLIAATRALQSGKRPTPYDKLVRIHLEQAPDIHNHPAFFAWHRRFLLAYERALQTVDPTVTIPYWDAGLDASAPQDSPVFAPAEFGGNGSGRRHAVTSGPFATWRPSLDHPHPLVRDFDRGAQISTFDSPVRVAQLMARAPTYERLRAAIEFGQHGIVHNGVGGDMAQNRSPNDPLFWMLHAYIDRIWAQWQAGSPAKAASYGGRNADRSKARRADRLAPFGDTVQGVQSIAALCYAYQGPGEAEPVTAATPRAIGTGTPSGLLATSVALTADRSVVEPGRPVVLTATVVSSEGAGAVTFRVGDAVPAGCAAVPLVFTGETWQARCTTTQTPAGAGPVAADFLGAGIFAPSTTTLPGGLTVTATPPALAFPPPDDATYGDRLGRERLSATTSVPGTLAYDVAPADGSADAVAATPGLALRTGSYTLRARLTPADGSPEQVASVPLTVDPAPLTITPQDKTIQAGDPAPTLTFLAAGFVGDDTPAVLLQPPVCAVEEVRSADGTQPIRCQGGSARDYTIVQGTPGRLTTEVPPCDPGADCTRSPPLLLTASGDAGASFVCHPRLTPRRSRRVRARKGADGRRTTVFQASAA